MAKDDLSGADIKAVCMEAGMLALRERRMRVTQVCKTFCIANQIHNHAEPKVVSESPADRHFLFVLTFIFFFTTAFSSVQDDFVKAKEKTLYRKKTNVPEGLYL